MPENVGERRPKLLDQLIELAKKLLNTTAFMAIALPGAIGGLVIRLLEVYPKQFSVFQGLIGGSILSMILGAAAALTAIVVLTNTERADKARLVTLSFLAGIVWISILPAGLERLGATSPFSFDESFGRIESVVAAGAAVSKDLDEDAKKRALEEVDRSVINFLNLARETSFQNEMVSALFRRIHETLTGTAQTSVIDALSRQGFSEDDLDPPPAPDSPGDFPWPLSAVFAEGRLFENPLERKIPNRIDRTEIADITDITLAQKYTHEIAADIAWFGLEVPEEAQYDIRVEGSSRADLVAVLYDSRGIIVAANDDSEGERDPKINAQLTQGSYVLRISDYEDVAVSHVDITFSSHDASGQGDT